MDTSIAMELELGFNIERVRLPRQALDAYISYYLGARTRFCLREGLEFEEELLMKIVKLMQQTHRLVQQDTTLRTLPEFVVTFSRYEPFANLEDHIYRCAGVKKGDCLFKPPSGEFSNN
jgi:hypothetical protein